MLQLPRTFLLAMALVVSQAVLTFLNAAPDAAAKPPDKTADASEDEVVDKQPATAKADPAAEKYWQAIKLLNSKQASELEKGREALQAAADLEYPHAQSLLAECLMTGGYGFPKDKRKAANLYRLAAERGNAFAQVSLGQCYFSGTGVRKDAEKASQWLNKALAQTADFSRPTPPPDFIAEQAATASTGSEVAGQLDRDPVGDSIAAAHYILGEIAGADKKAEEAQKHFVAAATAGIDGRSGIYPAAVQAALNYAFGQGTPRDMVKANEMLATSRKLMGRMGVSLIHNYVALKMVDEFATAEMEESIAKEGTEFETELQYKIALSFGDKKSKDYNIAEAVKWYELAAESGQPWAMLSLALIYSKGDLGQPDTAKAFQWFEKVGEGKNPKHYLGAANLAICYQNGIGTEKSPEKAAALFKLHRDNDIVCYLGAIGQCPDHIVTYEQELALTQTWAKEKKDAHAQYLLGNRYLNGWGVKGDFDDAIKCFKKAAKAGDGAALCEMGFLYGKHGIYLGCNDWDEAKRKAAEYYAKGVKAGNCSAMFYLAYITESGTGVAKDSDEAIALYEHCLQLDPEFSGAHNNLALIYKAQLVKMHGAHETIDSNIKESMLRHFAEANKEGNTYAPYNLGGIYRDGILCEKDLRKAYGFFETAAERGDVDARLIVGQMLENGEGMPVSLSEAAYHYRLAALDGNKEALRRLINFYLTGQGVDLDLDRAAFWINRMIRSGMIGGLIPLADILISKGEYQNAISLLKQMADLDQHVLAGYASERLSRCYRKGTGVKADPKKALKYFNRAIEYGNGDALCQLGREQIQQGKPQEGVATLKKASAQSADACYLLGQLYFFGTNVEKDEAHALQLMRTAAELNHAGALYFLAGATINRVPGAPSLDEAIRFAQQAETGGFEKARALREKLEKRRKSTNDGAPEETARARSS